MRILIAAGIVSILSACSPQSQDDAELSETVDRRTEVASVFDKSGSSVIELTRYNRCDRLSASEIIEEIHDINDQSPNQTWQSVLDAPERRFGVLSQLLGKCYKATPTGESAEKTIDIQHWSLALGGAAIAIEHALEDGSYGGISYVYPQANADQFTYVYITNAGFHTQGTIIVNDDQSFTASETVSGHPTITEVRSISRFDETGLVSMTSEFFDDGEWKPGPSFTHQVTTEPFPLLRPPSSAPEN